MKFELYSYGYVAPKNIDFFKSIGFVEDKRFSGFKESCVMVEINNIEDLIKLQENCGDRIIFDKDYLEVDNQGLQ